MKFEARDRPDRERQGEFTEDPTHVTAVICQFRRGKAILFFPAGISPVPPGIVGRRATSKPAAQISQSAVAWVSHPQGVGSLRFN